MSVKFFSVRSGEVVHAETEPMIAAYFNSSDLNPNGIVQDYGWRIHPNMVKRIREFEEDEESVEKLADRLQIPQENLATYHILKFLSDSDDRASRKAKSADDDQYEKQYNAELEAALAATTDPAEAEPNTESDSPKQGAPAKTAKLKVSSPAEIAAQKKLDDDKLAKMIADDDNKDS